MKFANCALVCFALLSCSMGQENSAALQKQIQSAVDLTPKALDFGAQNVGVAGAQQTATLRNNTGSPLKISGIFVSGIDFGQTNSCGETIPPGGACDIQVVFKPATTGARLGTLNVQGSDPGFHMTVLSGTGQ